MGLTLEFWLMWGIVHAIGLALGIWVARWFFLFDLRFNKYHELMEDDLE